MSLNQRRLAASSRPRFKKTLLAVTLASLACSAGAEEKSEQLELGAVVVTATGFEQSVKDAPAAITVISAEELKKRSYTDITDALKNVAGVQIAGGGVERSIQIRGMTSGYTLFLIDGRPMQGNDSFGLNGTQNGTPINFLPPIEAIERIEVIRGPASSLYGSDAMGGVINIITRKVGKEWAGSLTLDHTYQENRDFGDASKAILYASGPLVDGLLGLQLRGSLYDRNASDLSFDNDSTVSRRGASPVEGRNNNVGGRLTFTPHEDHDFALDIERGRQVYNNDDCQLGSLDGTNTGNSAPTTGCGPTAPRASGYKDELRFEREQYALSHTARLGFGTWDSSLTHSTTETFGRTIPGRNAGGDIGQPLPSAPWAVVGDDRELKTSNLVLDTKLVAPLGESHITSIGGQWWEAEMTDSLAQKDYEQSMWALFAEDEWRLRDDLALTLGVRYDDHETFGGHVSPRAYLVWNTTDNWTLKGGVSRGYKTPDLNDLHDGINGITAQGRAVTVGNPDLKPETSTSTEIGAYFDSLAGFKANATLFHNKFKDKIATGPNIVDHPLCLDNQNTNGTPNPGCAPLVNVDEAVTQGLELASSWQFAPGWTLSGNYTYTDSEQSSGANKGAPLTNTPQHMAHAKLNWKPTDRLSLWFSGEYRGERARFLQRTANLSAADLAVHEQVGDLEAYEVFHLGGSFKASQNVTLNASIYNLFDKDFLDGKVYTDNSGNPAWSSYYIQSGQSTTGTVEEGRRLWLSAVVEF